MTKKEKNNCGFDFIPVNPPLWALFNADCSVHDDNYKKGGSRLDRLTADTGFLWRMLEDSNTQTSLWKKRKAVYIAILYFILVRALGWITFKWY